MKDQRAKQHMTGGYHSALWNAAYVADHVAPSTCAPKAGASAEEGPSPFSSSSSSVAWLQVLPGFAAVTPSPCPLPSSRLEGRWLSCLFQRDHWHWILLSNLAPCLYCDEWGWEDDKQESLGRRSKALPGLPGAYLWLCGFGKFHPWECGACGELTSPRWILLLRSSGKREVCTWTPKGGPLKTESRTTCLEFFVADAFCKIGSKVRDPWSPFSFVIW